MAEDLTQQQIMQQLIVALQESRGRTEQQLTELSRKLDQLGRDLTSTESRLRADLQNQFVSRAEYDPRHKILEVRIEEFERHVKESEIESRQVAVTMAEVKQLRVDHEELDNRVRGVGQRAVPWIAVIIALISAVASILQHVQFR